MGKIYCLMGKSASGKDTLYGMIRALRPELLEYVMYATRPMRTGETDGVTYHFVTPEYLSEVEKKGLLIESRTYNTAHGPWTYATVDDGQVDLLKGSYLMPSTLESFIKLRDYYGEENVIPLYVEVDDGERLQRALNRERSQKEPKYKELCRRFLADSEDFSDEKLAEAGIKTRYQNLDAAECAAVITESIDRAG
ncbi:MAG: guanylate kinase [Lachnospiraceae bacterium]|nr:guanylate kinase [Lachnospiraceae bacterium]